MKGYRARIADKLLYDKLQGMGAVLVEGAKWCGKTTTAEHLAGSVLYMDSPKERKTNMKMVEMNPEILLQGETPRLIDEWQIAPELWDAVRFAVDHRDEEGQFILTGSASPLSDEDRAKIYHTGTGRIARLKMRTMSQWESGDSNGEISLEKVFSGNVNMIGSNNMELNDIAWLTCRGGWPRAVCQSGKLGSGQGFRLLRHCCECRCETGRRYRTKSRADEAAAEVVCPQPR